MKLRSAEAIATEFMHGVSGESHFCEHANCDCVKRLAAIVQWARHEGAEHQRRQDARNRIHVAPGPNRIAEALSETRRKVAGKR